MILPHKKPHKTLGLFGLTMINIVAIDNLRGLAIGAQYGLALIFIYCWVILFFLIPSGLVASELATGWPNTGGIYVWAREAFGPKIGLLVIWLQWIYNVVWYPTLTMFVAGTLAFYVEPQLVHSKIYMVTTTLIVFGLASLLNCYGMRLSSQVSAAGAILGTLLPIILLVILSLVWLIQGNPVQTPLKHYTVFPHSLNWQSIAFVSALMFSVMGIEMSASHAEEVKRPERNYPLAALISMIVVVCSLVFASLSIALVVPVKQLNIVSGLMQGFVFFLQHFHLMFLKPAIIACIVIGSLSSMCAWIIGPSKGLMVASQDGSIPPIFAKQNPQGSPVFILLLQGLIVSGLCIVFLLFPTVRESYWYLTDLTAQLALLTYIFFFASAIRLRYTQPNVKRHFRIPGRKIGVWGVSSLGIIACLCTMAAGFVPPNPIISATGSWRFEWLLLVGMGLFCLPPFILISIRHGHDNV